MSKEVFNYQEFEEERKKVCEIVAEAAEVLVKNIAKKPILYEIVKNAKEYVYLKKFFKEFRCKN